jgi:hypothetical protein
MRVVVVLTVTQLALAVPALRGASASAGTTVQPNSVQAFNTSQLGDLSGKTLNQPVVGMAATKDANGYWLVASDGGIFTFGDAGYYGSEGGAHLNKPVVGMAADPSTGGYWLVASDGGIFSFNAPYLGSEGGQTLNRPVVGMAATADGGGYWLVAADGGIFTFGDAPFAGSDLSDDEAPAIAVTDSDIGGVEGYRVAYGQSASPFSPAVEAYLAQRTGTVTAAVYDANSGATWQLNPGDLQVTASIVKVDIMATALQQAQQSGQPVPADEAALMPSMIEESDNDSATSMYTDVGGAPAVAAYNQNLGMTSTTPNAAWGLTTTTAADQVALVSHFAYDNSALDDASRFYGLSLMEHVEPDQAWGVSGGLPSGVTVALKNGWLPLSGSDWQVNSIGWVAGDGADYVLAVLTTGSPTEAYGIDTIQALSGMVFSQLSHS